MTFNGNDANSGTENPEIAGSPSTLSTNVFVNTGYSDAGRNTLVSATGARDAARASYSFHSNTFLDAPE